MKKIILLFLASYSISFANHGVPMGGHIHMEIGKNPHPVPDVNGYQVVPFNMSMYGMKPREPIPHPQMHFWQKLAWEEEDRKKAALEQMWKTEHEFHERGRKWNAFFEQKRVYDQAQKEIDQKIAEKIRKEQEFRSNYAESLRSAGVSAPIAHVFGQKFDQQQALEQIKEKLEPAASEYVSDIILNSDQRFDQITKVEGLSYSVKMDLRDYVMESAQAAYDFVRGVKDGTIQGFENHAITLVEAVKAISQNPKVLTHLSENVMQALTRPEALTEVFKNAYEATVLLAQHGSAYDWGQAMGKLGAQAVITAAESSALGPIPSATSQAIRNVIEPSIAPLGRLVSDHIERSTLHGAYAREIQRQFQSQRNRASVQGWKAHHKFSHFESAEIANAREVAKGGLIHPPFQHRTRLAHFTSSQTEIFARVHTHVDGTEHLGSWLLKKEAILGMTPYEIQVKYSLPRLPTHISEVHVPPDSPMIRGKVGNIIHKFEPPPNIHPEVQTPEGAIQYQLQKRIDPSNYKNTKPIGERVE